jgi:Zn-finger nucleic acid-binding protein
MSEKRTKRKTDSVDEFLSLEDHVNKRRRQLIEEREEVPSLKKRAEEIEERAMGMTRRWEHRKKTCLLHRADGIREECRARLSMEREHKLERQTSLYSKFYNESSRCKKGAYVVKDLIMDEFLTDVNNAPPKVRMSRKDVCPRCTDVPLQHNVAQSLMTCPNCGYTATFLDASTTATSFDDNVEFAQYSYKRVTHFSTWITQLQGREAHRVPEDIIFKVMDDLFERKGIRSKEEVDHTVVRESLRRLKLKKAYDHSVQVTYRINGKRPPHLTPTVESKLKNMFLSMLPAFNKHAPKTRTNFLSYSYVLYRCFQILGLHEMCDHISLLKGKEKLKANDAIFRKMCLEDLGWSISDLPEEHLP